MEDIMKFKSFGILAICLFAAMYISGCLVIDLGGCSKKKVKGSGNVVTETRQVAEFDRIHLKGSGKVFLTRGEKPSVEVKTDDNILPLIKTEVTEGKLVISHEKYDPRPTTISYFITANLLKGIAVSGSADVTGDGKFVAENFYADISGSGDVRLELEVSRLDSDISGSGSMRFSGNTDSLEASITGAGNIRALDMEAKNVSLKITGSGNCEVNATDTLNVKITGSGDVKYKGSPQISKKVTGSGNIRDIN
jgi:autotransporter translocation and assembly factor TamB